MHLLYFLAWWPASRQLGSHAMKHGFCFLLLIEVEPISKLAKSGLLPLVSFIVGFSELLKLPFKDFDSFD